MDIGNVVDHLDEFNETEGNDVAGEAGVFDSGEVSSQFFGGHESVFRQN